MEPEELLISLKGNFFEKISNDWDSLQVKCILCKGQYVYSTNRVTVKNLKEHLRVSTIRIFRFYDLIYNMIYHILFQRLHKDYVLEFNQLLKQSVSKSTMQDIIKKRNEVENIIVDYVVDSMKPLSTVDDDNFKKLIKSNCINFLFKII